MANISFTDNNSRYAKSFVERNYSDLANEIIDHKENLTHYIYDQEILYGYKINKNQPLTELYGRDFYAVRFSFANIDTLHHDKQEEKMIRLFEHLIKQITNSKGYYNLRIPTHIVDLLRAYNQAAPPSIFCGGTVEQYIYNRSVDDNNKNELNIFQADMDYIKTHREKLLKMTYESFETYQGQYHISHITDQNAGQIYENWINQSLKQPSANKIIVAQRHEEPIGFLTLGEDEYAIEGILSAVSNEHRKYGAYKAMIAYAINDAYNVKKCFVASTQFDNFIVQGVWNSFGLKPFYSIYNIHIDNK